MLPLDRIKKFENKNHSLKLMKYEKNAIKAINSYKGNKFIANSLKPGTTVCHSMTLVKVWGVS